MSNIVDTLNRLGNAVEASVTYLNSGGCCVYAALVARELADRGYPVKGVVVSYGATKGKPKIYEVRKTLNNSKDLVDWNGHVSFSHVGIEFRADGKVYRYDSNGVVGAKDPLMNMAPYPGRLKVDELEAFASGQEGWNNTFNRNQIPKLKKLVKSYFRDVTKVDGSFLTA